MKRILNENILSSEISESILDKVDNEKAYLSKNPGIPDIYSSQYLNVLINHAFSEARENLLGLGKIENVNATDLESALSELTLQCKKLEKPYRNQLEKICVNYCVDVFSIPSDTIEFSAKLVDSVTDGFENISVDPSNEFSNKFSFDDIKHARLFKLEVHKRKLLNVLSCGLAMKYMNNFGCYFAEIEKIEPKLCKLYKEILFLNNYLIYIKDDLGITDNDKKLGGCVITNIGSDDEMVRIEATATLFPILVYETFKGLADLFVSHGLPSDRYIANEVLKSSDYVKAEPWCMRFGLQMWNLFEKNFNDISSEEIPYLLKIYSSLDFDKFNNLSKEVFANTKKGRNMMSILSKKAKDDIEYLKFADKMDKLKTSKSMISDEFINESELDYCSN